jgi:hypothetical protein
LTIRTPIVSKKLGVITRSVLLMKLAATGSRPSGTSPCGGWIHSARDQLPLTHLGMKGELLVDFVGDSRTPEDAVERVHGSGFRVLVRFTA